MDIGPGDWVECVDASPARGVPCPLVVGVLYSVIALDVTPKGRPCLQVAGQRWPDGGGPWSDRHLFKASRFKPVYRPKADLIEQLSRPIVRQPEKVDA